MALTGCRLPRDEQRQALFYLSLMLLDDNVQGDAELVLAVQDAISSLLGVVPETEYISTVRRPSRCARLC